MAQDFDPFTEWHGFLASLWGKSGKRDGVFLAVIKGSQEEFTPAFCPIENISKAPDFCRTEMVAAHQQASDDEIAVVEVDSLRNSVKLPICYVSKNALDQYLIQSN